MKKYLLLMLLIIVLAGCSNAKKIVLDNRVEVFVEIADEQSEWEKGLMHRTSLDENKGMLFIFEKPDYYSFWMKNTKIPLDMIWIDEDKKIIYIEQAEPCLEDPCRTYGPDEKSLYVLEVNKGFSEKNKIKTGDKISF